MLRSLFISLFLFSSVAFSTEEPLSEVTIELPKQVKHSIERLWLSADAVSCLIQLNATSAPQQSCLAFFKMVNGHRFVFISTRVPFVTDGDPSPVMSALIPRSSLTEVGDTGDYTMYSGSRFAIDWSLSGE